MGAEPVVHLTNLPWEVDRNKLRRSLRSEVVELINESGEDHRQYFYVDYESLREAPGGEARAVRDTGEIGVETEAG